MLREYLKQLPQSTFRVADRSPKVFVSDKSQIDGLQLIDSLPIKFSFNFPYVQWGCFKQFAEVGRWKRQLAKEIENLHCLLQTGRDGISLDVQMSKATV